MIALSVIIVNYNAAPFLELCLNSVLAATEQIESEIIVVDNASTDNSCQMLRLKFPEIQLICNTENTGFAKANNQAVRIARGEYVLFLNPDTLIAENALKTTIDFVSKQSRFGALGVRMIDGTGTFLPESKRNIPSLKTAAKKILGSGRGYYADHVLENEIAEVEILAGAFLLLKKQVFRSVGGFDERYFMYGEDVDLSYTLLQAGFRNFYFGEESVLHFKGESGRKDRRYAENFYGAMQLFYSKHLKKNAVDMLLLKSAAKSMILLYETEREKGTPSNIGQNHFLLYQDAFSGKTLKKLAKVLKITSGNDRRKIPEETDVIIFDQQSLGNRKIIELLQKKEFKNLKKRILPENADFILGSDSSDKRGEVIRF